MPTYLFTVENPPVFKGVKVPRHDTNCTYPTTQARKDCRCPKWFYISPGRLRISAHTDSWSEAESRAADWVRHHDPRIEPKTGAKLPITAKPIIEAFDDFIADKTNSGLKRPTISKIRTIRDQLETWLGEWNKKNSKEPLTYIHELELEPLKKFFYGVNAELSGTTKSKRRGYLRQLYDHCLQHGWKEVTGETVPKGEKQIPKDNPANFLKASGKPAKAADKRPLSDELYAALLAACDHYERSIKSPNKKQTANVGKRAKLVWKLMYNTGFAITDAVTAQRSRLLKRRDGTYAFNVNRKKTGKEVYLKLDQEFAKELMNVPPSPDAHPDYFFWSGEGDYDNAADSLWRLFPRLLKLVKPEIIKESMGCDADGEVIMPTPHCLRYNFAENLFLEGATIAEVARFIGDTQEVVEKHYWKMSKKVQDRLDHLMDAVNKTRRTVEVIIPKSELVIASSHAAQA